MSGSPKKPFRSNKDKPQRSTFSRVVWILFAVAFIAVCVLVAMVWLMLKRPDTVRTGSADASEPHSVEIWQPNGASAVSQTYSLPPAADMAAASQASEPDEPGRPAAAPRRAAAASAPATAEEVPIRPVNPAPAETEIRPIDIPTRPAPQPAPPAGGENINPVDSLF